MDARRSAQSPTPLTVGIPPLDEEAILVSGPARSAAFPDALGLADGGFQRAAEGAVRLRPPRGPVADGPDAMSAERRAATRGAG